MIARKVMLLGEIGVGKSSIIRKLVFDKFDFDYKPTLGVDIYRYEVPETEGRKPLTLIVWDTDGNMGQAIFKHIYMKQAAGALILGDATRRDTLENMLTLGAGFREAFPGRQYSFIVNKIDLIAQGETADLPDGLKTATTPIMQTSAKTGHNVANAFIDLANAIQRRGL
ncbi:MAG: Rab family GTPase [Hyphomicrobiaceae bacterium]